MTARPARREDAATIARIYNEGIEDRLATFETEARTPEDMVPWFEEGVPLVVVEDDGEVVAWAVAHPYRSSRVRRRRRVLDLRRPRRRGRGLGRTTLGALIDECERRGMWKLVSRVFPENEVSLALSARSASGVGVYRRHAKLDGEWRDVVIVERLLGEARG